MKKEEIAARYAAWNDEAVFECVDCKRLTIGIQARTRRFGNSRCASCGGVLLIIQNELAHKKVDTCCQ